MVFAISPSDAFRADQTGQKSLLTHPTPQENQTQCKIIGRLLGLIIRLTLRQKPARLSCSIPPQCATNTEYSFTYHVFMLNAVLNVYK